MTKRLENYLEIVLYFALLPGRNDFLYRTFLIDVTDNLAFKCNIYEVYEDIFILQG